MFGLMFQPRNARIHLIWVYQSHPTWTVLTLIKSGPVCLIPAQLGLARLTPAQSVLVHALLARSKSPHSPLTHSISPHVLPAILTPLAFVYPILIHLALVRLRMFHKIVLLEYIFFLLLLHPHRTVIAGKFLLVPLRGRIDIIGIPSWLWLCFPLTIMVSG